MLLAQMLLAQVLLAQVLLAQMLLAQVLLPMIGPTRSCSGPTADVTGRAQGCQGVCPLDRSPSAAARGEVRR